MDVPDYTAYAAAQSKCFTDLLKNPVSDLAG